MRAVILISSLAIIPETRRERKNAKKLWRYTNETPKDGELIVAKREDMADHYELVRYSEQYDFDEVQEWCYLSDII